MQGLLVFGWLYVCSCVLGQMVSVGVVSDKVCINPVKIVLAGRAAGGSSWCLPAKLLTYIPGLKETIVIYWWVGGTVVFSLCLLSSYILKRESKYPKELVCSFVLETCSCTVYWFDIKCGLSTDLRVSKWWQKRFKSWPGDWKSGSLGSMHSSIPPLSKTQIMFEATLWRNDVHFPVGKKS